MRSDDKRVPALRLEGFEGEWEPKHIGDVFNERVESFPRGELLSVTTSSGIKRFTEVGRHDTSNADKSKYRRVEVGDIAYNSMRMWQGASGRSPYLGIVSPAYTVLAPKEGVDTGFFARLFKTPSMIQTFEKNSQGLTSDTWNLKFPALSRIEVWVPSLPEQHAISIVFDEVEHMISSSSDRLKGLTSLKQTMLVKMFPQGTASVPEVRFEGFEGDWERSTLGQVVESFRYGVNAAAIAYDGETKYLRITDIDPEAGDFGTGDVTSPGVDRRTADEFLLSNGDIVFARTGATVGRSFLYRGHLGRTVWAGFLIRAKVADAADPDFVYFSTLTPSYWEYVRMTSQRSGQPGLNSTEYSHLPIALPFLPEQQAIGAYFRNLDALIDAEQKKLATLRNLKSALLTQMFV